MSLLMLAALHLDGDDGPATGGGGTVEAE